MYEIANWEQHFEIAQSRKSATRHRWVAIPNDHGGRGYRRIMKQKNGLEIFAVWIILVQLASRAPTRGVLADEKGIGYTLEDMQLYTDVSLEAFERTMPFLVSLGWVYHRSGNALPSHSHCVATAVATTVQNSTEQNKTIQENGNNLELISSSEKYTSKNEVSVAWGKIPSHRRKGKGAFQNAWIYEIARTDVDGIMVGDALEQYYKSNEGRGEYARKPATLITDQFWGEGVEVWNNKSKPEKFTESPFDHEKIIKEFCAISPENVKIVALLRKDGKEDARIAYKIWSKKL